MATSYVGFVDVLKQTTGTSKLFLNYENCSIFTLKTLTPIMLTLCLTNTDTCNTQFTEA